MPKNGVASEFLATIEDLTAEILSGRDALIELEAVILANRQYGGLSDDDAAMLLDATDKARQGIRNGLRLAKLIRTPPPDLDSLIRLVDTWEEERRAQRRQATRPPLSENGQYSKKV